MAFAPRTARTTPPKLLTVHPIPDNVEGSLSAALIQSLVAVSAATSLTWISLWLFAPAAWWPLLRYWVRYESGLGILACVLALIAASTHLRLAHNWPTQVQRMAGGMAIVCGIGSLIRQQVRADLLHQWPALSRMLDAYCGMGSLAALAVVATGAAAILHAYPQRHARCRVALYLHLVVASCCAGLLAGALLSSTLPHIDGPNRLMLPAAALSLLTINLAFLLRAQESRAFCTLIERSAAGALSRRVFVATSLSLLLFGLAIIALRQAVSITHDERSSLLTGCAFSLLALGFVLHSQLLRRLIDDAAERTEALRAALTRQQQDCAGLHAEHAQLGHILRATHSVLLMATDCVGNVTLFSAGAERLLGYTAEEVVGRCNITSFFDEDELGQRARELGIAPGFDTLRALPNLGRSEVREWTFRSRENSAVMVSLTMTAIYGAQQQVTGYLALGRDVTRERRVQHDRDGLLLIGQELLVICDLEGHMQHISPSFTRVFGYASNELLGRRFLDFVHTEDVDKTHDVFDNILRGLFCERYENRWRGKDGRYHWISWDAALSRDGSCVYAGGWDLTTERAHLHKINELLASEQHLIGIVSHDLRNPLTAIDMAAQLLLRHRHDPDTVTRRADQIIGACKRAERLIYGILDLTQVRLGHGVSIEAKPGDVVALAREVIDEVQLAYPRRRLVLQADADAMTLDFDYDRMAQVLQNLITNAVKYSPLELPVTVTIARQETSLQLSVHNGGKPISEALLPEIFDLLRRDESSPSHVSHSIGLGLFIVRKIVEAHHASIAVDSNEESGTTFRITLPLMARIAEGFVAPVLSNDASGTKRARPS